MANPMPLIDSHIHLWPESELETLAWYTTDSPLGGRRSVEEFRSTTGSDINLKGFVFIEADRKNDESKDWNAPLQEVDWVRRIAAGQPKEGEGHSADDAKLCLAIIPWAPVVLGVDQLEKYITAVENAAGPAWNKVKGFRYLLQDKPNGTALGDDFIAGLKLLGRKGLVFDVGVDQHRRGRLQLEELVEMIDRAHDGVEEDEKVVLILSTNRPIPAQIKSPFTTRATTNKSHRSSLQTRLDYSQPDGPFLHCMAHRYVYSEQVQSYIHEVKRLFRRDAR